MADRPMTNRSLRANINLPDPQSWWINCGLGDLVDEFMQPEQLLPVGDGYDFFTNSLNTQPLFYFELYIRVGPTAIIFESASSPYTSDGMEQVGLVWLHRA